MKTFLFCTILILIYLPVFAEENPWQKIEGEMPPPLTNASMVEIDGNVYLFGGSNPNATNLKSTNSANNFLNELWIYNEGNNDWLKKTTTNAPSSREYHAASKKNGKMYVFGGKTATGAAVDLWEYDPSLEDWALKSEDTGQNPKLYHQAAEGDTKIWITGGMDQTNYQASGEIWAYDPQANTWERGTDCPSPRYGHASWYKDGKVYLAGGRRGDDLLSDMWQYDIASQNWQQLTVGLPNSIKFPGYCANNYLLFLTGGYKKNEGGDYVPNDQNYTYSFENNNITTNPGLEGLSVTNAVFIPNATKSASTDIPDYRILVYGTKENANQELVSETWIYDSSEDGTTNLVPGIKKNDQEIVKVFPTLTKGKVTIQSMENIQMVTVFDFTGKQILKQGAGNKTLSVGLNGKPEGIYLLKIKCKNQYYNKKVVLSK